MIRAINTKIVEQLRAPTAKLSTNLRPAARPREELEFQVNYRESRESHAECFNAPMPVTPETSQRKSAVDMKRTQTLLDQIFSHPQSFSTPYADAVAPTVLEQSGETTTLASQGMGVGDIMSHPKSFGSPYADAVAPTVEEQRVAGKLGGVDLTKLMTEHRMSFGSPYADAVMPSRQEQAASSAGSAQLDDIMSHPRSFATPYADTFGLNVYEMRELEAEARRSRTLLDILLASPMSFGSPYADAVSPAENESVNYADVLLASPLSFSSPYADTVAPTASEQELAYTTTHVSFATPYSDFVAGAVEESTERVASPGIMDNKISFGSPYADVVAPTVTEQSSNWLLDMLMASPVSFSEPFADITYGSAVAQTDILASASPVDAATEEALIQALPRSLQAAMEASEQARVITESRAPFRIVHVNKAWEGLCGFSQAEAVGKSLDILQGARTKSSGEFKRLESHLQGEPKGISVRLVNYTKAGRPFVNQLRVVPLHEGSDEVTHMLGVLEDVSFSHSKNQQAAI